MKRCLTFTYFCMLASTACGSHSSASPVDSNAVAITNTVNCAADSRVTAWSENMKVAGKAYTVILQADDPAQPAEGINAFTFVVQDANGNAVDNANVTITPWMPDHGHGPSVLPQVTDANGVYTGGNVDFFMAGVWQLTFAITDGSTDDQAVVDFCISG